MSVHPAGVVAACLVTALGCAERPVEVPTPRSPQPHVALEYEPRTPRTGRTEVDVLFVIDDSTSMAPKQWALRQRFPKLIERLSAQDGPGYDLHIGVTSTDLGAPGRDCGYAQGGVLGRIGHVAANGCRPLEHEPYLHLDTATGASNTPDGQDALATFACMASVGEIGCGYEMPLESAMRTLVASDRSGFLRDDALLVVVFVTDEDDCSVDDPHSDLFSREPGLGLLDSFRCAQYGIVCDGALLPSTPQASFESCRPATAADGGKLAPLEKYRQLFTARVEDGGLKADPRRIVLASLAGPSGSIAVVESHSDDLCGEGISSCAQIAHSCDDDPRDAKSIHADPALRLGAVLDAAPRRLTHSICDTDYSGFFSDLADEIGKAP